MGVSTRSGSSRLQSVNPSNKQQSECNKCNSHSCCIGDGLTPEQFSSLEKIIHLRGPFQPGETIFKMEDPFKSLYIVRSGSVKTEGIMSNGTQLVEGFYFAGDIFGLEAIGDSHYRHDAVALEPTWVCTLPYAQLETLCSFTPRLQHRLFNLLGQKIRQTNSIIGRGRYRKADERALFFLECLYKRNIGKKDGGRENIRLPMTKGDIASYLALCPESLSRSLRKLEDRGIIQNHKNAIEVLDLGTAFNDICK
ncbi:MAG: Crp/Fnr family transcriptional regulator [Sedimenticola sp.]